MSMSIYNHFYTHTYSLIIHQVKNLDIHMLSSCVHVNIFFMNIINYSMKNN